MAISNIYRLHSITLIGPNITIGAMSSVAMPTDAEVIREVNASRLFAYQAHTNFRSLSVNFTSWDLAQLLANVGVAGECIGVGETITDVAVNVAQFDCNGAVANGTTVYTINKGIIFPTSITVDHQGNAQISYTIIAIYDGSNDPVVKTINQAVPTVTVDTEDLRWTMYDAFVDSVQVTQTKSINIDFGAQSQTDGADSEPFDSWVSLDQILPVITFQGIDPHWLEQATAAGTEITDLSGQQVVGGVGAARIRLKERGTLIGVGAHVFIDMNGLARITDPFSSTGNDTGRTEMRIEAHQIGTNAPLIILVNQIIPPPV